MSYLESFLSGSPKWRSDESGEEVSPVSSPPGLEEERHASVSLAIVAGRSSSSSASFSVQTPTRRPAETEETPPADGPCYCCHRTRFWLSVYGVMICATCHPPAVETLVVRWLDLGVDPNAEATQS